MTATQNLDGLISLLEQSKFSSLLQKKAFEKLECIGQPSKKMEAYKNFPLIKFNQTQLKKNDKSAPVSKPVLLGKNVYSYQFIDGNFANESDDALPFVCMPLEKAKKSYSSFFQSRLSKLIETEKDPLALLHFSMDVSGVFFYIPPGVTIEKPIAISHLLSDLDGSFFPRIHIAIGKNAKVDFVDLAAMEPTNSGMYHTLIDFSLEEDAKATLLMKKSPSTTLWDFTTVRASIKKGASLKTVSLGKGSLSQREDYHVRLEGEESCCDLNGLAFLKKNRQLHTHILVDHIAEHTTSYQFFKTALFDHTRSSFNGKIFVERQAQKTDAYQLNNNLVLSDNAVAYSRPNLEIFADDVKASHGSTFGEMEEEDLFYLQTRGIDAQTAKEMLIQGFGMELVAKIPAVHFERGGLLEDFSVSDLIG